MANKIRIALLSGGASGEREVSLKTGGKIYSALDKSKYEIFQYDPKTDLKKFFNDACEKKFDLVFPALHGSFGEDGRLQGMLDMIGMPYVFSGCSSSALAMNKHKTKIIAREAGLDIADYAILKQNDKINSEEIINKLSLPVVIKPIDSGSSVGMSIANKAEELERGIVEAFKHSPETMLEKFIKGRELTVAVLQGEQKTKVLPVIEIIPKVSQWFDYKAKYEVGGSEEVCPARIPDEIKDKVQKYALKIFNSVECKDLARADFIWSQKDDKIYFLEINTIPGMTQTSLAPQAAEAAGIDFGTLLDILINNNIKSDANPQI